MRDLATIGLAVATSEKGTKRAIPQELATSLSEVNKEGVREVFFIKDRQERTIFGSR